jgi:hypothetical protein
MMIRKKIAIVRYDDWTKRHICWDFPAVDRRCLAFCCSPKKKCQQRDAVLKKIGITKKKYEAWKKRFGETLLKG